MTIINFKRLFEIRILHDYFLTSEAGASFFGLTDADKQELLVDLVQRGQYNIRNVLTIEPHPATVNFIKNHKMRLLPSDLGVVAAIQVTASDDGGDTVYTPFVPLEDEDELVFYLKVASPFFHNFTNLPWQSGKIPAIFTFSNEHARDVDGELVLARPPAPFGAFPDYMMGDLVEDGSDIKEVFYPLNSNTVSLRTVASDGFVNREDRQLLPKAFYYDFQTHITDAADFEFFDSSNNLVKAISKAAGQPYRFVKLDITKTDDDPPEPIPDGDYRLEVTTTGGINEVYEMTFSDHLYNADAIGVVRIRARTGDVTFDLLDGDGRLVTRVASDGTRVSHPIFELRFLSRYTYWRYQQHGGFTAPSPSPDYLELVGDKLISKSPRPLTDILTFFEEGGSPRQYLPNAKVTPLKFEEKKIFSEIYISSVNRLTV